MAKKQQSQQVKLGPSMTEPTPVNNGFKPRKTACPVSREEFRKGAKAVMVRIGEFPMIAEVKEFSSGSLGWFLNGKTVIEVNGVPCSVQIGMNLTIVNSKELPS